MDHLSFRQDASAAYVIPARLDGLTVNEVDLAARQGLEFQVIVSGGSEGYQRVRIARTGIKIGPARCGAEVFEPYYAVAAAEFRQLQSAFRDIPGHGNPIRRLWRVSFLRQYFGNSLVHVTLDILISNYSDKNELQV
jgi:hypothetical protein